MFIARISMKKFTFSIKVMFSDCDPAQIVFYPRYFQWFDIATQRMFNGGDATENDDFHRRK